MKTRLLLLLFFALATLAPPPPTARADDMAGPYVYKTSVHLNTQHYLVYWPSETAKEPQYLTGSWAPKLDFNIQGPLEGGSQISVTFAKPGGVKWFTRNLHTDEVDADNFEAFSLDGNDLEKQATLLTGTFTVTITLSNALTSTDKTLYTGKFVVHKFHYGSAPTEVHQADYWVDNDWNLPLGQISFDDDPSHAEAPPLMLKLWFRGPLETDGMAGYLYYGGKLISDTKTAGNVGAPVVIETGTTRPDLTYTRCTFDFSRVAKSLTQTSANNYDSFFFLDKHPGDYEMKVLRDGKLARSVKFTIGPDGALVDNTLATQNKMGKGVTLLPVTTILAQDGPAVITNYQTEAYYGNPVTGFP